MASRESTAPPQSLPAKPRLCPEPQRGHEDSLGTLAFPSTRLSRATVPSARVTAFGWLHDADSFRRSHGVRFPPPVQGPGAVRCRGRCGVPARGVRQGLHRRDGWSSPFRRAASGARTRHAGRRRGHSSLPGIGSGLVILGKSRAGASCVDDLGVDRADIHRDEPPVSWAPDFEDGDAGYRAAVADLRRRWSERGWKVTTEPATDPVTGKSTGLQEIQTNVQDGNCRCAGLLASRSMLGQTGPRKRRVDEPEGKWRRSLCTTRGCTSRTATGSSSRRCRGKGSSGFVRARGR